MGTEEGGSGRGFLLIDTIGIWEKCFDISPFSLAAQDAFRKGYIILRFAKRVRAEQVLLP